MLKKIRELTKILEKAGFRRILKGGSYRQYMHADGRQIALSGNGGGDAKLYWEQQVQNLIW